MSPDSHIVYFQSPAGLIEVRASEGMVCAISFVNHERYTATENIPAIDVCITQLKEYFDGTRQEFYFPYRQEGSDFQQKVWQELEKIPFGTTVTYTEQTRRLGDMKALRAVAAANGKNKLAIVVPCHRVIGTHNKLTGYAGGLDKKLWLLEHERQFMQPEEGKLF